MNAALEVNGSNRIVRGQYGTLEAILTVDGRPARAAGADLAYEVRDTITGEVLKTGTPDISASRLSAPLTPADTATVRLLTVSWSGVEVPDAAGPVTFETKHEIIGELLFTIGEARQVKAGDSQTMVLSNEALFPNEVIERQRDRIHDDMEWALNFGLGARYRIATIDGWPEPGEVWLPDNYVAGLRGIEMYDVWNDVWTAFDDVTMGRLGVTPGGQLYARRTWPFLEGVRNVRVYYEAGADPIPGPLRHAALLILAEYANPSQFGRRALSVQNEMGNIVLARFDPDHPFGIPEVDATIVRYRRVRVGIS